MKKNVKMKLDIDKFMKIHKKDFEEFTKKLVKVSKARGMAFPQIAYFLYLWYFLFLLVIDLERGERRILKVVK